VALHQALFIVSGFALHHSLTTSYLSLSLENNMALAETSFFYNLMFTLRWLIQQCLSAQHMWLPVYPFVNPL
jgi:hypothetical protein